MAVALLGCPGSAALDPDAVAPQADSSAHTAAKTIDRSSDGHASLHLTLLVQASSRNPTATGPSVYEIVRRKNRRPSSIHCPRGQEMGSWAAPSRSDRR